MLCVLRTQQIIAAERLHVIMAGVGGLMILESWLRPYNSNMLACDKSLSV